MRKFGASSTQNGSNGLYNLNKQNLVVHNVNSSFNGQPHNFLVQGGNSQKNQQMAMMKNRNNGMGGIDRNQLAQMRMSPEQKTMFGQALHQKRSKASSGLTHFKNNNLVQNPSMESKSAKQVRNNRVRSQMGNHQPMPLDPVNMIK